MKYWKIILGTLLTTSLSMPINAQPRPIDEIIVIVNNGVIKKSDAIKELKSVQLNARARRQQLPPQNQLQQQVVNKLIVDEIQLQEAKRIGVQIDDARLDDTIKRMAAERRVSVNDFARGMQSVGLNFNDFREQIRKEMTISEARSAIVRRRINISPSEIDALADKIKQQNFSDIQYKISQIQINVDENKTKQQALQEAKDLLKRINDGEEFSSLAYTNSDDQNALKGGDSGWMSIDEMPTVFAEQVGLKGKGEVIGPFSTGIGVHLLRIDDLKGSQRVTAIESKVQHILIKPSVILSDNGARQQLDGFIKDINAGKHSFAELAQKYSADVGSAINDGILDYQTSNKYVPEFKARVDSLPVGKISEPFKTQFGWHILKVLDKRTVDKTEEAVNEQAYQILMKRKFNEEASAWIQEIRAAAYIESPGK